MATTPNLGLPIMESGQAQKHVTFNEAMVILDEQAGGLQIDLDLSAATVTGVVFPAGGLIIGCSWRVLETVTFSGGGATWALGDDGDGDTVAANATRYASGLAPNAGVNGYAFASPPFALYAAGSGLRVTPDAGAVTGGVIRLRAFANTLSIPEA